MTYELPPNPLGGLASDIDLAVAVAGDEPARRRIAVALHRDGLNVTAEAGAPDQLADACRDGVPHVAVLARSACHPHTAAAVRTTRRPLPPPPRRRRADPPPPAAAHPRGRRGDGGPQRRRPRCRRLGRRRRR